MYLRAPIGSACNTDAGNLSMAVLVNETTQVTCQGIADGQGKLHIEQAIAHGTRMVGRTAETRGAVAETMQAQRA